MPDKSNQFLQTNLPYTHSFPDFKEPVYTETELYLKSLTEQHPELYHQIFQNREDFLKHFQLRGSKLEELLAQGGMNTEEDAFIQSGFDVNIFRRIFYLPGLMHSNNFMEIKYIYSGSCTFCISQDTRYEVTTGDIIFIPPNTPCCILENSRQDFSPVVINIILRRSTFDQAFSCFLTPGDVLSDFFSHALYSAKHPVDFILFHCGKESVIHEMIGQIYEENFSGLPYREKLINTYISQLLILILRYHEKDIVISSSEESDQNLMEILQYIREHFATVTLQEISDHFNYSQRQMRRIIKNGTGHNFSELIKQQKLNKSADLLKTENLSLDEICQQTGFHDTGYFCRFFKENMGMTPSQFRSIQSR
ncbi:MAG: AraC family transcriptional regulator [Clostridiales bacterium]|nr:AraC family transcriptional regulator [Clostridiales bacterium]